MGPIDEAGAEILQAAVAAEILTGYQRRRGKPAFGVDQVIDEVGGRASTSFLVPGGHCGTIEIKLAALSGAASLARIKAEIGASPTAHQPRPLPQEEILANRYFKRIEGPISLFLYAQAYGNYFFNNLPTPVTMRAVPTVTRILVDSA